MYLHIDTTLLVVILTSFGVSASVVLIHSQELVVDETNVDYVNVVSYLLWSLIIQFASPVPNRISLLALVTHDSSTDNMPDTCSVPLSNSIASGSHCGSSHFLTPCKPLNLGSVNVRTLIQAGQ